MGNFVFSTPTSSADFDIVVIEDSQYAPAIIGLEVANPTGFAFTETRRLGIKWDFSNVPGMSLDTTVNAQNIAMFGSDLSTISTLDLTAVYCDTPGTYEISCQVTDGTESVTKTANITLTNANWLASETIYVDTSAADGVRPSWAPTGALAYHNDLGKAMTTWLAESGRNRIVIADDQDHSIMFGDRFVGARDVLIERAGNGTNRPNLDLTSGGQAIDIEVDTGNRFIVKGIKVTGTWDPLTETGGRLVAVQVRSSQSPDWLVVDCHFTNLDIGVQGLEDNQLGELPWVGLVNTQISDTTNYAILIESPVRIVRIGCLFDMDPASRAGRQGKIQNANWHGTTCRYSQLRPTAGGRVIDRHCHTNNNVSWPTGSFAGLQPAHRILRGSTAGNIVRSERTGGTLQQLYQVGDITNATPAHTFGLFDSCYLTKVPQGDGAGIVGDVGGLWVRNFIVVRPDVEHLEGNNNSYRSPVQVPNSGTLVSGSEIYEIAVYNCTYLHLGTGTNSAGNATPLFIRYGTNTDAPLTDNNNITYVMADGEGASRTAVAPVSLVNRYNPEYESYQDYLIATDTSVKVPDNIVQLLTPQTGSSIIGQDAGYQAFFDFFGNVHNSKGAVAS